MEDRAGAIVRWVLTLYCGGDRGAGSECCAGGGLKMIAR